MLTKWEGSVHYLTRTSLHFDYMGKVLAYFGLRHCLMEFFAQAVYAAWNRISVFPWLSIAMRLSDIYGGILTLIHAIFGDS